MSRRLPPTTIPIAPSPVPDVVAKRVFPYPSFDDAERRTVNRRHQSWTLETPIKVT